MYTSLGNRWRAMTKPTDLVQGTLDLLILKMLALEPLHGWAISQRLKQVSDDTLQVSDGSLYPALHKLEQEGWIKAEWKPSENNRRAKFYTLTRPRPERARAAGCQLESFIDGHLAGGAAKRGLSHAFGTLVLHCAVAASVTVSPRASRSRAQ